MLSDLPQSKWESGTGRQVILKGDFEKIEDAIVESFEVRRAPRVTWVDATQVQVNATEDCPARLMMCGFPSPLHPGHFVGAGLTDGKYRANSSAVSMDFDVGTTFWGTEKSNQWYALFAVAGDEDSAFTLQAMPWMRVKSQSVQTISLGTLVTPATGIGYGFVTDELVGAKVLFVSGASAGLVREISANNNDSGTGGTITYSGAALSMVEGDIFVVLPATNFRWLLDFWNDASGNIAQFTQAGTCVRWVTRVALSVSDHGADLEQVNIASPLAVYVRTGNIGSASYTVGGPANVQATCNDGESYEFAVRTWAFRNIGQTNQGVLAWWYPE